MLQIFNTLTKNKEAFKPLSPPHVGMYNCGPTVYDYAHIGNLRAYVFADVLRRTLELHTYEVEQVVNITDVGHLSSDADDGEDKMTKALKREGKPMTLEAMKDIADTYTYAFLEDIQKLNIQRPQHLPRASEHIEGQRKLIESLNTKGLVYQTRDGLYFDTTAYPAYGKLGGSFENTTARVAPNSEKKDQRDFALWKFNDALGWDSPLGIQKKGFPGWHIECSAMSMEYLGESFDIHTGGIDHIAIHHNNEIAQSEGATGKPLANYWMHSEFVVVADSKMAKSEGTGLTLRTLEEQGVTPLSYRYFLLNAHYRSPVTFSMAAVTGAQNALEKLYDRVSGLPSDGTPNARYLKDFRSAIDDDLNTPKVIALAWDLLKDDHVPDAEKKATLLEFDRVLGLGLEALSPLSIPPEVQKMVDDREDARTEKRWEDSDAIREQVLKKGFRIDDTDQGPMVHKLRA